MVSSHRAYQRKRDYDNGGGSDHHDDHVRTQHFAIAVYHGSRGKHPRAGRCLWCLSCLLICHLNMAFSSHVNEPSCQWTHGSPVARTLIVTVAVASVIRFFIETSTMLRNLSHFLNRCVQDEGSSRGAASCGPWRSGPCNIKVACDTRNPCHPVWVDYRSISSIALARELAYGAFANSIAAGKREFFPPDLHLHMIRRLCEYSAHFANVTLWERDPRIARHPRQA